MTARRALSPRRPSTYATIDRALTHLAASCFAQRRHGRTRRTTTCSRLQHCPSSRLRALAASCGGRTVTPWRPRVVYLAFHGTTGDIAILRIARGWAVAHFIGRARHDTRLCTTPHGLEHEDHLPVNHEPMHFCELQSLLSTSRDGQALPPNLATRIMSRERVFFPPPHTCEQSDQSPNGDAIQSIGHSPRLHDCVRTSSSFGGHPLPCKMMVRL